MIVFTDRIWEVIKTESLGCALICYDWCSYKKRRLRHSYRETTTWRYTERKAKERASERTNSPDTLIVRTGDREKRKLCCLRHPVCDICYGRPNTLICCCSSVAKSCLTLATPRTVAQQSMGFPRREYWSAFHSLGDFPNPGIKPTSASAGRCFTTVPPGKPSKLA